MFDRYHRQQLFETLSFYIICVWLFFIPLQTVWLIKTVDVHGAVFEYETLKIYATEFLLLASVFFAIVSGSFKRAPLSPRQKIGGAMVLIWFGISLFWVQNVYLSLQSFRFFLEAGMAALLIARIPKEQQTTSFLWVLGGGILQVIVALCELGAQQITESTVFGIAPQYPWIPGAAIVDVFDGGRMLRAYGSFPHPNILGGYLALIAVFCLGLVSTSTTTKKRLLSSGAYLCVVFGVFATISRSAILGLIIGSVMLIGALWYEKRLFPKKISMLVVLGFLSAGLVWYPYLKTRITGNTIHETASVSERVEYMHDVATLFLRPTSFRGLGVGQYTLNVKQNLEQTPPWRVQPVHNTPLLFVLEWGAVGLFLLLLGGAALCKKRPLFRPEYVFLVTLLPPLFFDHYLYSLYPGLMILGLAFGLSSYPIPTLSTPQKQGSTEVKNLH